ncbi:hypothetical protein PPECC79_31650 [Escherichia coli PCN079]|nr:hypothetical protein PPECC79_31650 [Escherichia coli PCN079]CDK54121.1 hypothetical protein [Escherichia coli IS5]
MIEIILFIDVMNINIFLKLIMLNCEKTYFSVGCIFLIINNFI